MITDRSRNGHAQEIGPLVYCGTWRGAGDTSKLPGSNLPGRLFLVSITAFVIAVALLFILAADCTAEEPGEQHLEYVLNFEEARDLTSFGILSFPGLGQSLYSDDGSYSFTDDVTSVRRFGIFEVQPDGKVCIDFHDDSSRCDTFIRRGGLYFLLREDGSRFPIYFGLEGQ